MIPGPRWAGTRAAALAVCTLLSGLNGAASASDDKPAAGQPATVAAPPAGAASPASAPSASAPPPPTGPRSAESPPPVPTEPTVGGWVEGRRWRGPAYARGVPSDGDAPRERTRPARVGPLFSLGFGGGEQYVSGVGHAGALDFDLRFGFGFSDRFQFFFDLGAQPGFSARDRALTAWLATVHGQTVLYGDRAGNGLNLHLGVGMAGLTAGDRGGANEGARSGLAVAGGLSFDFRTSRDFALSPELFANWQQVPNRGDLASDIGWAWGVRLNFLWYAP